MLGVPEIEVLSPLLFNLYLEEALKLQKKLAECIRQDRLRCYADDILITGDSEEEIKHTIAALSALDG